MSLRPFNLAAVLAEDGARIAGFHVGEMGLAMQFKIALEARQLGYKSVIITPWGVDVDRYSKVAA